MRIKLKFTLPLHTLFPITQHINTREILKIENFESTFMKTQPAPSSRVASHCCYIFVVMTFVAPEDFGCIISKPAKDAALI